MKKSELRKIILEELRGYSKYAPGGETKGGTTDDFRDILTAIAKSTSDIDNSEEEEETVNEEGGNLSASEIADFVQNALNLRDYDVDVRLHPNHKEVKLTIKQDPSEEDFNTIVKYLEDNGYTVDQIQSRREGEDEGDRYLFPRIVFK